MKNFLLKDGLSEYAEDLKDRAYLDLRVRARGGILIYAVVWLFISNWAQLHTIAPLFVHVNTAIILALAAARTIHYFAHAFWPDVRRSTMQAWLTGLILTGALHWGLMTAYMLMNTAFAQLHLTFVVVIAALALGGTTILSISPVIRVGYPLMLFIPTIFAFVSVGSDEFRLLFFLTLFSMFYVYVSSAVSAKDYWRALQHEKSADERTAQVERLSNIDPLTHAHNRLHMMKEFEAVWQQCESEQEPLSLLMIDLDQFKQVNDNFGHVCGDECLKATAEQISDCIRRSDLNLSRYGGEEFVILLPGVALKYAHTMAERIRVAVEQMQFSWEGTPIPVRCSIGVACAMPAPGRSSARDLIQMADDALYAAKDAGRNRCVSAPYHKSSDPLSPAQDSVA